MRCRLVLSDPSGTVEHVFGNREPFDAAVAAELETAGSRLRAVQARVLAALDLADLSHPSRHTARCPDHQPAVTDATGNLHGVCRGCHTAKHRHGWTIHPTPDGHITWRSPHGSTTTHPPHDLRTDDRTPAGPRRDRVRDQPVTPPPHG